MQADILLGGRKQFSDLRLGQPDASRLGTQIYLGLAVLGAVEDEFTHSGLPGHGLSCLSRQGSAADSLPHRPELGWEWRPSASWSSPRKWRRPSSSRAGSGRMRL